MRVLRRGMSGSDVKQWQEFLTRKGFGAGTPDGSFGNRTVQATVEFQRQNGLGADGVVGPGTLNKAKEQGFAEAEDAGGGGGGGGGATGGSAGGGLSEQALAQIMPNLKADKRAAFFPFLVAAMNEFSINTPARQAAFLAQLAHESAEFRFMEEIWGPTAAQRRYEGRRDLGNTQTGDGFRFKGRGPIQITGRFNYKKYGDLLGLDLIGNPQSAATPEVGFRIAWAYWDKNNINAPADRQDIVTVTKLINGGTNGLEDRKKYYERAKRVLGVSGGTRGVGGPASATRGVGAAGGERFTRGLDESGESVPTAAERNASEGAGESGTRGIGVSGGTRSAGASGAAASSSGATKGGAKAAKKAAKKPAKKAAAKKSAAKKSSKKAAAKKSTAKKPAAKKTAAKKAAKKPAAKKSSAKKSASKKSAKKGSKPGASKKSSGKKSASKKGGRRGNR